MQNSPKNCWGRLLWRCSYWRCWWNLVFSVRKSWLKHHILHLHEPYNRKDMCMAGFLLHCTEAYPRSTSDSDITEQSQVLDSYPREKTVMTNRFLSSKGLQNTPPPPPPHDHEFQFPVWWDRTKLLIIFMLQLWEFIWKHRWIQPFVWLVSTKINFSMRLKIEAQTKVTNWINY